MLRVLLVPSSGIRPVNDLVGTDTLIRCQAALELIRTGEFDVLVLSGGHCFPPEIETQPAAMTMAGWFFAQGMEKMPMVIEGTSHDTYENVGASFNTLRDFYPDEEYEITVVSQWQHTIRLALVFRYVFGIKVKRIPLHYKIPVKTWIKEWGLILYHLYDRRGTKLLARFNRACRTVS